MTLTSGGSLPQSMPVLETMAQHPAQHVMGEHATRRAESDNDWSHPGTRLGTGLALVVSSLCVTGSGLFSLEFLSPYHTFRYENGDCESHAQGHAMDADGNAYANAESIPSERSRSAQLFKKMIWHGGSVYDAWLNTVAAQVGQVILSMPTSYAQMGLKLGIFFHLFYVTLGTWTCYMLAKLYIEYRYREEKKGRSFKNHVVQYYEVIGSLVGDWAKWVVLIFNMTTMSCVATVQIIACSSDMYYVNDSLNKREWALIFGGVLMLTVLLPTFHNFRMLSLIGMLTTTYTSWYMFTAALKHGKVHGVTHSGPKNLVTFFVGTTNILFATGGHSVTVEMMYAIWKPKKFPGVYTLTSVYILSITMPHCIALYLTFGDRLLRNSNALSILPVSNARTTALILMTIHQAVAFSYNIVPIFLMWEKLWGMHTAWFPRRVLLRVPPVAFIWFLAILIPFFGPLNSIIGSISCFNGFIIPAAAYLYVFWKPQARQDAAQKLPKFMPFWPGMVTINVFVVAALASLGLGLGTYASISNIRNQIKTFGFFDKCYQC